MSLLLEYRVNKFRKFVNEAKQVGDIYHVVPLDKAAAIAESDQLGLSGQVFFTRDRNFNILSKRSFGGIQISVKFTVDGDKLSENYKVDPTNNHVDDGDIQWEVLVDRNIKDFHKYVTAVDVTADTNSFRGARKGSWGEAESDFDLVIKSPNMSKKYADMLFDSLSALNDWCKKNGIEITTGNSKITVRQLLNALKNFSDENKMSNQEMDFKKAFYTLQINFKQDFDVKKSKYKGSAVIVLDDKKDLAHRYIVLPNGGEVILYETQNKKEIKSTSVPAFLFNELSMRSFVSK